MVVKIGRTVYPITPRPSTATLAAASVATAFLSESEPHPNPGRSQAQHCIHLRVVVGECVCGFGGRVESFGWDTRLGDGTCGSGVLSK